MSDRGDIVSLVFIHPSDFVLWNMMTGKILKNKKESKKKERKKGKKLKEMQK